MNDAKRFLLHKMSQKEANQFRQLLQKNPHLKEEFDLMQKMVSVMRDIPESEIQARLQNNSPNKFRFKGKHLVQSVLILVFVAILIFYSQKRIQPDISTISDTSGVATFAGAEKTGLFANTASGLAIGPDGHIYIGGNFYREITIDSEQLLGDSNSLDFFLVKLTADLKIVWARSFGSPGDDYLDKIAVDQYSNLIFSGSIGDTIQLDDHVITPKSRLGSGRHNDLFIASMDPSRKVSWVIHDGARQRPYVNSGTGAITRVVTDQDNHIYAVGLISASSIWSHPIEQTKAANSFLVKLDNGGQIKWIQTLVGEYGVKLYGVDVREETIAVSGLFGHSRLGGDLVLGDTIIPAFGGTDIVLAQFDTDGKLLWGRRAGSPLNGLGEGAYSVKYSEDGSLKMTGNFDGSALFDQNRLEATVGRDFFLASYHSDGKLDWVKSAGGGTMESKNTDLDMGAAMDIDAQGNIYVSGIFASNAVFDQDTLHPRGIQDLFVAKYTPTGELLWIKPFGGDSEMVNMERAMELVVNEKGDCYVTGFFSGDLFIDDHKLESKGRMNIFILTLDVHGRIKQFNQLLFAATVEDRNDPG